MRALELPRGAPTPLPPPWKRQRPVGLVDESRQGVPSSARAPQMRRLSCDSTVSTNGIQSSDQRGEQGVPCAVVRFGVEVGCGFSLFM